MAKKRKNVDQEKYDKYVTAGETAGIAGALGTDLYMHPDATKELGDLHKRSAKGSYGASYVLHDRQILANKPGKPLNPKWGEVSKNPVKRIGREAVNRADRHYQHSFYKAGIAEEAADKKVADKTMDKAVKAAKRGNASKAVRLTTKAGKQSAGPHPKTVRGNVAGALAHEKHTLTSRSAKVYAAGAIAGAAVGAGAYYWRYEHGKKQHVKNPNYGHQSRVGRKGNPSSKRER